MTFNLKSFFVEEETPTPEGKELIKPVAVSVPVSGTTYVGTPNLVSSTDSNAVYGKIVAQTDWKISPVFQSLQKFLGPMDSMQIDPKTKFQIALAQAVAQDHINPGDITASFEQAKNNLNDAKDKFTSSLSVHLSSDVDALKKKAEELQEQVKQLTEQAFAAEQKLREAQHQFDLAYQTRLNEISQEQAKYSSMLS